jgi:large subunit ribosomal protein L30
LGGVQTETSLKAFEQTKQTMANKTVKVKLLRSTIGFDRKQAAVVRGLGLRRIRHTVELPDTPATRGMIHKVRHLVEVAEQEV